MYVPILQSLPIVVYSIHSLRVQNGLKLNRVKFMLRGGFIQKGEPSEFPDVGALRVLCKNVMAGRSDDVLRHIDIEHGQHDTTSGSSILTASVRKVLQSAPGNLRWQPATIAGSPLTVGPGIDNNAIALSNHVI